jgi:sugar phosphate isomerase/epimerase
MLHVHGCAFLPGMVHHAAFIDSGIPPAVSTLELLKDPFFGALEGAWDAGDKDVGQVRRSLQASLVEPVYCIGGLMRKYGLNPSDRDPEARESALRKMESLIDDAQGFGAKLVVLCSGPDVAPQQRARAKEILAQSLQRLCRYAAAKADKDPLWLSLEHFDRDVDQKQLLGPTEETVKFVDALAADHTNIGITLDLSHIKLLEEDVRQAVRTAANHLVHIHIANCIKAPAPADRLGDKHPRFGMAGSAVTVADVAVLLDELYRQGFFTRRLPTRLPVLSLEIKPVEKEDPFLLIANGKRMLREAVYRVNAGRS